MLFIHQVETFYSNRGLASPFYGLMPGLDKMMVQVYIMGGQTHCSALRDGVPMQAFGDVFDQYVEAGDSEGATFSLALASSAVAAYCPEYTPQFNETFPAN